MAGLVDWLLAEGAGSRERFLPVTYETPNGTPLQWRWTGAGEPRNVILALSAESGQRVDTLRVDAGGGGGVHLPPGGVPYAGGGAAGGGAGRGGLGVGTYFGELGPAAPPP